MSTISDIYQRVGTTARTPYQEGLKNAAETESASVQEASSTEKKVTKGLGRTVGNAALSETAAEYYKKLKEKFKGLDFVLVSADQKETVKQNPAAYAGNNGLTVLIDEEKLERMATDKEFAAKYEGIISSASANLNKLSEGLKQGGGQNGVVGYGAVIKDDGTASYFAVVDKSLAAQQERIKEKREAKKAEKKDEEKKAAKEKEKERLEKSREKNGPFKPEKPIGKEEDQVTFKADSVEELLEKLQGFSQNLKLDFIKTPDEQALGGSIDFRG